MRAHQATPRAARRDETVDVSGGLRESAPALHTDIAPHVRLPGQSAADLDGPGSPNAAGRQDHLVIHAVRRVTAPAQQTGVVGVRHVGPGGTLGGPCYLDPTDLLCGARSVVAGNVPNVFKQR